MLLIDILKNSYAIFIYYIYGLQILGKILSFLGDRQRHSIKLLD